MSTLQLLMMLWQSAIWYGVKRNIRLAAEAAGKATAAARTVHPLAVHT
jgi:hypothetical protein